MPAHRLYLHIGTHKTGTTSFQASLGKNRRRLRKQGYGIVPAPRSESRRWWYPLRYNLGTLAQSFLRDGVATVSRLAANSYRLTPDARAERRAAALARIARRRAPSVIVSAEAFTFLRTPQEAEALRGFLAAIGREVVVVVAWREDSDWQASWHDHIAKHPARLRRNRERPDAKRADGDWYFDKPAIRAFWSQFGDLREVDYDAAIASEGNVIPALYRAMDVDPTGFEIDISRNRRRVRATR